MVFHDYINMDYDEIVQSLYLVARRRGNYFDFNDDKLGGGIKPETLADFADRHGLRFIFFHNEHTRSEADITSFWGDYVGITQDHAVPIKRTKQLPNPDILKEPEFYYILTHRPYMWGP